MHKLYSTTVTDMVADKQFMVHLCDNKFFDQQAFFDQSIVTEPVLYVQMFTIGN